MQGVYNSRKSNLESLQSWNFISAPGIFNCQLKYDNMPITETNLVRPTSLNPRNCILAIFMQFYFLFS